MGGDILVKSELGLGSTFEIFLMQKNHDDILRPDIIKLEFGSKDRNNFQKIEIDERRLNKVPVNTMAKTDPFDVDGLFHNTSYESLVFNEDKENVDLRIFLEKEE